VVYRDSCLEVFVICQQICERVMSNNEKMPENDRNVDVRPTPDVEAKNYPPQVGIETNPLSTPDVEAKAFQATVIAEIDRLAQLLAETKKIAADMQEGVKLTSIGVIATMKGVIWTRRGVIATIVLSFIAIGLSTANILLYLKVI
jgi:hypothetical protein